VGVVELRLLGPVEIDAAGRRVEVGHPRQRCVLAALAADAGRLVPVDTLVDRVWGTELPGQPRQALYAYLARIRRLIDEADPGGTSRLVHRSGGYLLDVDPDRVDLHRFRRLVTRARDRGPADPRRVVLLREALDLWRRVPLAGLTGEWPGRVREGWQREYLDAVTAWADAELPAGNAGDAVVRLTDLVEQHPLDESLAAALMRALHAAGRGADALDRYAKVRGRLVEKLGVDPGPELQRLHQAILRGERSTPAQEPAAARQPRPTVPAQLPADARGFAGRTAQLDHLDAVLAAAGTQPTALVMFVLSGTAGIGKTTLAVHWAHRVRDRFPDGQLYVNLRGFDPTGAVLAPADAIRRFLDAFDVPPPRIPTDLDAQVALYRSLLADRRMLIVLSVAEARELLTRRLAGRVAAQPDAVDKLITRCARLPLALAVVAAHAATQPRLPLAALADQLRDAQGRLDALSTGDAPATDLRAVFSWSYRTLSEAAARLFRLLGRHPGPDLSTPARPTPTSTSVWCRPGRAATPRRWRTTSGRWSCSAPPGTGPGRPTRSTRSAGTTPSSASTRGR